MKLKSVFAWLCVVALAGSVLLLYASNSQKGTELVGLRAELQEQRAELEQAKADEAAAHSLEIDRLRKDNADLLRLRNEVRQLRDDKQQLTQQTQTAQAEAQRAQVQAAQTALASAQLQQQQQKLLQAENQRLLTLGQQAPQAGQIAQRNTCINILRQMDGAKQQWALEHGKTATAIPTPQDIAPYMGLKDGVWPTCPAGGTYTLNAVNAAPTCSVPGHALPQ